MQSMKLNSYRSSLTINWTGKNIHPIYVIRYKGGIGMVIRARSYSEIYGLVALY